jgi:hypothetical protein
LEENSVAFDFVYVDLLEGDEREAVKDKVRVWNPRVSFPPSSLTTRSAFIGFKTDELRERLKL